MNQKSELVYMLPSFDDSDLVLVWGLSTALGWIATVAMGIYTLPVEEVMGVWSVLMAVPLLMTAKLYYDGDSNKLFNFWALAIVVLMLQNFLTPGGIAVYSYFHLWLAAGAVGFYYTSTKLPPPSEKTYRYAAIASVIGLGVAFYQPITAPLLAVVLQGTPMLYDWYTVHR